MALSVHGPVKVYDPHGYPEYEARNWRAMDPTQSHYDLGVSIYVLNTLIPPVRETVLKEVMDVCDVAVFAVRTDKIKSNDPWMDGVITRRNTFQTQKSPQAWSAWFSQHSPKNTSVKVLHKAGHYCILEVRKKG